MSQTTTTNERKHPRPHRAGTTDFTTGIRELSKQIATNLFLSKRTIDFHRANLLKKFGAKNAAMMVRNAVSAGLVK